MRHFWLFAVVTAWNPAAAEVWMPSLFGDNMVLQQGRSVPVWGKASPGEKVTVTLDRTMAEVTADANGRWKAMVGPLTPGSGPLEMRVRASNELVFRNVLAGDVWVCAGQSNMAWPLSMTADGAERAKGANFPEIRFFRVARQPSFELEEDPKGKWVICTPKDAPHLFATAYYFGREIHATRKTPVGLICAAVGGTPAQLWTSPEKLAEIAAQKPHAERFFATKANLAELRAKLEREDIPRWQAEVARWKTSPEPRGEKPRQPSLPSAASLFFNGMIHPLMPYAITGVIWYQGEANSTRPAEYAELFPAMIQDWRARWGQGDFPFLFVQLAGFRKPNWVATREAQKKALTLPATAMAVAIDIGQPDNIHPKDKQSVGRRLALAARHVAYGEEVEYSGPVFAGALSAGDQLVVSFDHVGGGLQASTPAGEAARELHGFEIAGSDGLFHTAVARIEGAKVILASEKVPRPVHVRYAWADWPEPMVNLYNKNGLPAVPFTSRPLSPKGDPE